MFGHRLTTDKGPYIKNARNQKGEWGLSIADIWFFKCGRPHFLKQKLQIFRNLRSFRTDKVGSQLFAILCDVFHGWPLNANHKNRYKKWRAKSLKGV